MKIRRNLKTPTGNILVVEGQHGLLEMLSLADYGADVNLNQGKPVPDGLPLMPLTKKWVVTVSTQYGCRHHCRFCDVPMVGSGQNATYHDLWGQIETAMTLPDAPGQSERLNIHFARMGEPTWNIDVCNISWSVADRYRQFNPHPVVSTMMPRRNPGLREFLEEWMRVKNKGYDGNAGLQISINSTHDYSRQLMFNGDTHKIEDIATIMNSLERPRGRKITLNFAVANYIVEPEVLLRHFDPQHYVIKLTPMHKTSTAETFGVHTEGDYTTPEPYVKLEAAFRDAGYDVLVFIASRDEDLSRITCGNAILSGTMPHSYKEIHDS